MFVGSGSPKKQSLFVFFFSFLSENVSKWRGSSKSYFRCFFGLFLIGPPLGAPGFIFIEFWAPWASFWHLFGCPGHHFGTLGAHQNDAPAVQNSMKMNPQTNLAVLIFLSFEIPGYHFGTLDPPPIVDPALPGSLKFNENESSKEPGEVHCSGSSKSLGIIL